MSAVGALQDRERTEACEFPPLSIVHYPLQRGYHRAPFSSWLPYEMRLLERLRSRTSDAAYSPLICTTPFYAPLAEKWPGPVIYYVTDLTAAFAGINAAQVIALDRRLCRVAHAVCPNSSRLAEYLATTAGCSPAKITIVPNATRASNISPEALYVPGAPPADIADLPRPLIGVIGNQAANLDWELLAAVVQQTPRFSWVFVGPTSMPVPDRAQREARSWVMARARFTGSKPYGDLQAYARSLDAAVLPYRMQEPTYSGSSTRFYEHLAACRPMIATLAFHELLSKQPLVKLVDTAAEMTAALASLEAVNFHDGLEEARWQASQDGTWEARARAVQTLAEPCSACVDALESKAAKGQPNDGRVEHLRPETALLKARYISSASQNADPGAPGSAAVLPLSEKPQCLRNRNSEEALPVAWGNSTLRNAPGAFTARGQSRCASRVKPSLTATLPSITSFRDPGAARTAGVIGCSPAENATIPRQVVRHPGRRSRPGMRSRPSGPIYGQSM